MISMTQINSQKVYFMRQKVRHEKTFDRRISQSVLIHTSHNRLNETQRINDRQD